MAKATIDFKGKKYTYSFPMPSNLTKHNIALAIAIAKGKKEGVTKYTGIPKDYNLIIELLNHNSRYCYHDDNNTKIDYFQDATQRNSEESVNKIRCDCFFDMNIGNDCPKCNGHGYYFERLMWRIGYTQNKVLIIDIDGQNKDNLNKVKSFYETLLYCKFTVIKSNKGYWLISDKEYHNIYRWKLDQCRILNPFLHLTQYEDYVKGLEHLDFDEKGNFKKISVEDFKKSRFYMGCGDFDVMFTLLSIKRERSTLRISKKRPDDKIEVIA